MLRILTTGKPPKGTGKLSEVIEMLITLNKVAATSVCVCPKPPRGTDQIDTVFKINKSMMSKFFDSTVPIKR